MDERVGSQLAQVLDEVVDERVVVVDDEDTGAHGTVRRGPGGAGDGPEGTRVPNRGRPGSLTRRLSASKRILTIEDEADIAEFLRAYFRASGYDLVPLDPSSPEEVVGAVDAHRPDVVLLDYGLRGFSGHEA